MKHVGDITRRSEIQALLCFGSGLFVSLNCHMWIGEGLLGNKTNANRHRHAERPNGGGEGYEPRHARKKVDGEAVVDAIDVTKSAAEHHKRKPGEPPTDDDDEVEKMTSARLHRFA